MSFRANLCQTQEYIINFRQLFHPLMYYFYTFSYNCLDLCKLIFKPQFVAQLLDMDIFS